MKVRLLKRRLIQLYCYMIYVFISVISLFSHKIPCWLISERGFDARDNGIVFYQFLKKNHPEIKVKYVISKKSPDLHKIDPNDIIKFRSLKHYWYYKNCGMLISTHYHGYSPNLELFSQLDKRGFIRLKGKKVFLQHGITKDKMEWSKKEKRVDLLITSIGREYDAVIQESDYDAGVVQLLGMPRFDILFNINNSIVKNKILIMPTWRIKYTNYSDADFICSDYFKNYNELLNSKIIEQYLEDENLELLFYPHIEIHKFLHLFSTCSPRVKILGASDFDVQTLLLESKLLITDFSSVFFDFGFLGKPVIYFQFDKQDFRKNHYEEGWFSYENDGLGPIALTIGELEKIIINRSYENNLYKERNTKMFDMRDNHNCERVFEAIVNLKK